PVMPSATQVSRSRSDMGRPPMMSVTPDFRYGILDMGLCQASFTGRLASMVNPMPPSPVPTPAPAPAPQPAGTPVDRALAGVNRFYTLPVVGILCSLWAYLCTVVMAAIAPHYLAGGGTRQ